MPWVLPDHMVHTAGLRVPSSDMLLSLFPLWAPIKTGSLLSFTTWNGAVFPSVEYAASKTQEA